MNLVFPKIINFLTLLTPKLLKKLLGFSIKYLIKNGNDNTTKVRNITVSIASTTENIVYITVRSERYV